MDEPPFMHPSGMSYAALALTRGAQPASWIHTHAGSFHVLELSALDPNALTQQQRTLATLSVHAWEALTRGDRLVLTAANLVVGEQGLLGLGKIRVYPRSAWETFARGAGIALTKRHASALCARPASSELCWEPLSAAERNRFALALSTMASAALTALAALALGYSYIRERRRMHRDRIHVLRTLTHELRTPATSLGIDIEPLRAAYDDLPVACQEPLLRISDAIERLHRVLHRSARYMALFETPGDSRGHLLNLQVVASARQLFEQLAQEWPEDVHLTPSSEDRPLSTDPDWLAFAIKNLVENGARHGQPPVVVAWVIDESWLVVRVSDRGHSVGFSLRDATTPFLRGSRSPGLGLGLAIVERVARLLGGRLSHEPSPTVFELRVPCGGPS